MKVCKWVAGVAGGVFLLSSALGIIFAAKAGWRSWEGMGERIEELRQEGAELPGWLVWPLN